MPASKIDLKMIMLAFEYRGDDVRSRRYSAMQRGDRSK